MKFRVIYPHSHDARSPIHIIEQTTGGEVGWINRYLDREYVRRLADSTLRTYAHNLLHFVRWWESIHHTGDIVEGDLTESTLLDYVRFQSSQQPRPSASLINDRVAVTDRALRNQFPNAPCQVARGFHQAFLRRGPMGLARPRQAISRLRVRVPKRNIVPLSVNEVAHFWSSFRTSRDLAIVGLMLLHGLRSAEVMALNRVDVLLAEAQLRVRGKGNKLRILPLAPESIQLLDHYLRLERPNPCSPALFVSLKGPARGTRMSAAGLRSLFRYHRRTTGLKLAHPHRFRHTFASDMVRAGISLPALMQLMGAEGHMNRPLLGSGQIGAFANAHAGVKLKTERMVPVDFCACELVQRLAFFRSLDPLPADGRLLARASSKQALVRQLRDYLHQVCHTLGLSTRIVPHQLRHTYATEMLRAGVSFPVLMKLLGHTSPDMTMRYVDVALTDLQREYQLARSRPRHLVPQPKVPSTRIRSGLQGVIDSLLAAQHVLEMFRRVLPHGDSRACLDRLSNRLTKIVSETRTLRTPEK